jgi:hypothetical protein
MQSLQAAENYIDGVFFVTVTWAPYRGFHFEVVKQQ